MDIGFIGLGAMGGPMASNLLQRGHRLRVFDIRREAAEGLIANGATWSGSPVDAVAGAAFVFTCLPGPREFSAIAEGPSGLVRSLPSGSVWFDLTTNAPSVIRDFHGQCADRGVQLMDSPSSGGPSGAASKKMALWVGGDRSTFLRSQSLLHQIADTPTYVGPSGSGNVVKLVHNSASFAAQILFAEAFTVGVKAGIDPLVLFNALRDGTTGRSRTFDRLREQFLPGVYDPPAFKLQLAHKDMCLALELAKAENVPMQMIELATREMSEAVRRGWGDRDARIAMTLQEERAGVSVKVAAGHLEGLK